MTGVKYFLLFYTKAQIVVKIAQANLLARLKYHRYLFLVMLKNLKPLKRD